MASHCIHLLLTQKTPGEVEQDMIQSALEACEWRIEAEKGAAMRLDLAPGTLRKRIRKYRLNRYPEDEATTID